MSKNNFLKVIIVLVILIIVLSFILLRILKNKDNIDDDINENLIGLVSEEEYTREKEKFEMNINNLDDTIKNKITNWDEFQRELKNYMYDIGLNENKELMYIGNINNQNGIELKFEVASENINKIYAYISYKDNKYNFFNDFVSNSEYYRAKNSIQKYVDYLNTYSIYNNSNKDIQKSNLINILSENYIKNNNIASDNILNKVEILDKAKKVYPISIEKINFNTMEIYRVRGVEGDFEYKEGKQVYYIVYFDSKNYTYAVQPLSESEYEKFTVDSINISTINENDNNVYEDTYIDKKEVSTECFNRYIFLTMINPKLTFNQLNEEYRIKRFENQENYISFIKEDYNNLNKVYANMYYVEETSNENEYIIKDQFDNLYIFNGINPLVASVKLDTYTIDEEKFNNTYDSANNYKKVQMNIDKFIQMINRHDYRTSYGCLAESFIKNMNIKNEGVFKQVVEKSFYTYNKIEFVDGKEVGNKTYMYKMKLTDLTEQNGLQKTLTIIMQLKENRDFVMSFSIE